MLTATLLACWLIACAYIPLVLALTREPPSEVRRVTNALVGQRAAVIAAEVLRDARAALPTERRWRSATKTADTLTAVAPAWALEESAT